MWLSFWTTGRQLLKLSDQDFYSLTPRQFDALLKAHLEQAEYERKHAELLMGIVAATIVNHGPYPPKKAVSPSVFMPTFNAAKKGKRKPRKPRYTKAMQERFTNSARSLFASLKAQGKMRPAQEPIKDGTGD